MRRYYEALYDKELQGLICFSCGCVHPHLPGEKRQKIAWQQVGCAGGVGMRKFLSLSAEEVEDIFGVQAYLGRYGARGDGYPDLNKSPWREELAQWACTETTNFRCFYFRHLMKILIDDGFFFYTF